MNTLRTNPNIRLAGPSLALTAALLGPVACAQPDTLPTPHPSETGTLAPDIPPRLTCSTKIMGQIIDGTVKFGVNVRHTPTGATFTVSETEYDFGDGQTDTKGGVSPASHTYLQEGHYEAEAAIRVSYSRQVGAPPKSGITNCDPISFYVEKP